MRKPRLIRETHVWTKPGRDPHRVDVFKRLALPDGQTYTYRDDGMRAVICERLGYTLTTIHRTYSDGSSRRIPFA